MGFWNMLHRSPIPSLSWVTRSCVYLLQNLHSLSGTISSPKEKNNKINWQSSVPSSLVLLNTFLLVDFTPNGTQVFIAPCTLTNSLGMWQIWKCSLILRTIVPVGQGLSVTLFTLMKILLTDGFFFLFLCFCLRNFAIVHFVLIPGTYKPVPERWSSCTV